MSRKLVAYFSATGTTTKVAELLADAVRPFQVLCKLKKLI